MSKNDRRTSRREAFNRDKKERDEGVKSGRRQGYLASDAVLEELGIGVYIASAEDDGAERLHKLHLMPAHLDDPDLIGLKIYCHYGVGPDDASYLCPKEMGNYLESIHMELPDEIKDKRCPVCEHMGVLLAHYKKNKDKVTQEEREFLYSQIVACRPHSGSYKDPKPKRMFTWVVNAADVESEDEGVKIFLMPTSVYQEGVIELHEDSDETDDEGNPVFVDMLDPVNGHYFLFKRKGKKFTDTKYSSYRAKKRKDDISDWLEDVPQYFDVLKFASYDEIKEAFDSGTDAKDDTPDDDSDDTVKDKLETEFKRSGKKEESTRKRKRRNRDEAKDDDDDPVEDKDDPIEDKDDPVDDKDEDVSDDVKTIRERVRRRREKNNE